MIKVGLIGATGYAGQQLVYLLRNHPSVTLQFVSSRSHAGASFETIYPAHGSDTGLTLIGIERALDSLDQIDLLFLALPHGKSAPLVAKALALGKRVIDLGADFRLKDAEEYSRWYGETHPHPELLGQAVYGLPELNRKRIVQSDLIANPGCYPTASVLALAPLIAGNLIDPTTTVIDAKSGVSGAGRSPQTATLFAEVNESMKAYAMGTHRHTPEIEQTLGGLSEHAFNLVFTPHLVPMNRGILATCYAQLKPYAKGLSLTKVYERFYEDEPFVRLRNLPPETRWVRGTNFCDLHVTVDNRTNRVLVVSVIDNLIKGAAGQAVQNMNLLYGLKEDTGLTALALAP